MIAAPAGLPAVEPRPAAATLVVRDAGAGLGVLLPGQPGYDDAG